MFAVLFHNFLCRFLFVSLCQAWLKCLCYFRWFCYYDKIDKWSYWNWFLRQEKPYPGVINKNFTQMANKPIIFGSFSIFSAFSVLAANHLMLHLKHALKLLPRGLCFGFICIFARNNMNLRHFNHFIKLMTCSPVFSRAICHLLTFYKKLNLKMLQKQTFSACFPPC